MSKSPPSEHWVRDYRARFPLHKRRIDAYQKIAYWRDYRKQLPPDDIIGEIEVALRADPPDPTGLQLTIDIWARSIAQLEAWRNEREALEDLTLTWLNASFYEEGSSDA